MCIYVEYDSAKAARSELPRAAEGIYVRICDICISYIHPPWWFGCNMCMYVEYYSAKAARSELPRAAESMYACTWYVYTCIYYMRTRWWFRCNICIYVEYYSAAAALRCCAREATMYVYLYIYMYVLYT